MTEKTFTPGELKVMAETGIASVEDVKRMALLLSEMDSEPVGEVVLGDYDDCGDYPDAKVVCIAAEGQADWNNFRNGTKLYAAPPAPVAVPDKKASISGSVFGEYYCDGWNACRAAMLNAGPVTGWINCSERMPEEGGRYWCYVEEQNSLGKSHYQWNCSWNGDEWSDKALTGRVTHWMPLPAAPEQE